MNGDLGKIYKAINQIATDVAVLKSTQQLQHEENKSKMEKVDNLPCKVHIERMKWFNKYLVGIYSIVAGIVSWIAYTHIK